MQVMSSVQYQNKKVVEPIYELDILVSNPDLNDDTIYSSNLTFINTMEGLNKLISSKIQFAQINYIDKMQLKSKDVQAHKKLLRKLEKHGLSIVPDVDDDEEYDDIEFKSCGDIKKDIENIKTKTLQVQTQLFELDELYRPLHTEIKKLQSVKHSLQEFSDNYKIQLSQLNRVLQRIGKYIADNKSTKDSTNEAIKATKQQQHLMVSKISEKIAEIQLKIKKLEAIDPPTNDTMKQTNVYKEYLRGLQEFIAGLNKLQQTSLSKIKHLDCVVEQLQNQRATINQEIRQLKSEAINKLKDIRIKYLTPSVTVAKKDDKSKLVSKNGSGSGNGNGSDDDLNNVPLPDYKNNPSSTMVGLLHSREKYMNRVYKRIHDLESRALTTSSRDFLDGLTEIRELQIIFNNNKLKYFYNKYVSLCNEVFNDCCLASQAILEYTAEINSPIITQLKGVELLNSVLKSNKYNTNSIINNNKVKDNKDKDKDDVKHNTSSDLLDIVVDFIQSLPDREVVIMQVARYLATSLPFRNFILGIKKRKYRNMHFINDKTDDEKKMEEKEKLQNSQSIYGINSIRGKDAKQYIKIDGFVMTKIREWMGSILHIYGNNGFTSVKIALENDVVAQVRPSTAARIIVNCVYGLDVSW